MALLKKLRLLLIAKKSKAAVFPLDREELVQLDTYDSALEGDRKVLEQLLSHGADLSKPRHVVHYLYFAEPDDRERAYGEFEVHGYDVDPGRTFPENERPYSLLAERVGIVGCEEIDRERKLLCDIAARFRGQYDGWEAALD